MENIKEIWKTIDGYDGYQVSNLGRVKSLKFGKEKILKSANDGVGYLIVGLSKEGKIKTIRVHRLVAQAFLPNHDNLPQVNHKDEDKTNNMVWVNDDGSVDYNKSNLEWCDAKYNINYGNHNEKMGKSHSKPILQFTKNGEFIKRWDSTREIERELGISNSNITACCKGKQKSSYGYIWMYAVINGVEIDITKLKKVA